MIRGRKDNNTDGDLNYRYGLIAIEGAVVGLITGLVGAGGGFLIIPALVLLVGLPMKQAVATSLAIIAVKSLFGFIGDLQNLAGQIDWSLLIIFSALSLLGIVLGAMMSKKTSGEKLKKAFGYFVLLFSFFIIYQEGFSLGFSIKQGSNVKKRRLKYLSKSDRQHLLLLRPLIAQI